MIQRVTAHHELLELLAKETKVVSKVVSILPSTLYEVDEVCASTVADNNVVSTGI